MCLIRVFYVVFFISCVCGVVFFCDRTSVFEGEVCVLPILVWGDVLPPIICLSLSGIRDRHSLLVDVVYNSSYRTKRIAMHRTCGLPQLNLHPLPQNSLSDPLDSNSEM